jgi:hypothetical protein
MAPLLRHRHTRIQLSAIRMLANLAQGSVPGESPTGHRFATELKVRRMCVHGHVRTPRC